MAKWVKTLVINENYDDFLFGVAFYKIIFKVQAQKQSNIKAIRQRSWKTNTQPERERERRKEGQMEIKTEKPNGKRN